MVKDGCFAVGVFSYELGGALHDIAPRVVSAFLSQVLLFERCERLSAAQVEAWLDLQAQGSNAAGIGALREGVTEAQFAEWVVPGSMTNAHKPS